MVVSQRVCRDSGDEGPIPEGLLSPLVSEPKDPRKGLPVTQEDAFLDPPNVPLSRAL